MSTVSYKSELERSGTIVFAVTGSSMRPLFHSKTDAVVVKKCDPKKLGNLDIVLHTRTSRGGEQFVLHRIVGRKPDGRFIIAGDNCFTADIVPPRDILGTVVSAQRGNEPIRLSGLRYALYKALWCKPYRLRFFLLKCRKGAYDIKAKIRSHAR